MSNCKNHPSVKVTHFTYQKVYENVGSLSSNNAVRFIPDGTPD